VTKYHILDEEKIKGYLSDNKEFILTGVNYVFDDYRELRSAEPLKENALVITKDGIIKWSNPSREIHLDGTVTFEPVSADYGTICNNYVCIDRVPENRVKISELKIRFADAITNTVKHFDVNVYEDGDELILNYEDVLFEEKIYNILVGVMINGQFVSFKQAMGLNPLYLGPTIILPESFNIGKSVLKQVISKGTCFKSMGEMQNVILCYE